MHKVFIVLRATVASLPMFFLLAGTPGFAAVVDLPLTENLPASPPLAGPPTEIDGMNHRLVLPLSGGTEDEEVFATIVFHEKGSDTLRVYWFVEGFSSGILLAEDLCDGVLGWNQKTLRLPKLPPEMDATLEIESSGPASLIKRVALTRAPRMPMAVAPDADAAGFVTGGGRRIDDVELSGETVSGLSIPDVWLGEVLEARLLEEEGIMEFDGPVEFLVPIEAVPELTVLEGALLEPDVGVTGPTVWVNGTRLGNFTPEVPDLRDHGYLRLDDGAPVYAGWRRAACSIPASLLHEGDNSIIVDPGLRETPVYLRDPLLQLRFAEEEAGDEEALIPPDSLEGTEDGDGGVEPPLPVWEDSPREDIQFRTHLMGGVDE